MSSGLDLLFSSDANVSVQAANQYTNDVFQDVSLPATNNTGVSNSVGGDNPLGSFFGNDDSPRWQSKLLLIKDVIKITDQTKSVNGQQAYQIIWNENLPAVQGYAWGPIQLGVSANNQRFISIQYDMTNSQMPGIGVDGAIVHLEWLIQSDSQNGTAIVNVDSGITSTALQNISYNTSEIYDDDAPRMHLIDGVSQGVAAGVSINQNHDFQFILTGKTPSNGSANLYEECKIIGVLAYFDLSATAYSNVNTPIEVMPGNTYINKVKATTTIGATLAPTAATSNLGARNQIIKGANGVYSQSSTNVFELTSTWTGTAASGATSGSVALGTGGSFPVGTGVMLKKGTSAILSSVVTQSTDTLTLSFAAGVNIPFDSTAGTTISRMWRSGISLAINSSTFAIAYEADLSSVYPQSQRFPYSYCDPGFNYFVSMYGITAGYIPAIDGYNSHNAGAGGWPLIGTSNQIMVAGLASAIALEFTFPSGATIGGLMLSATLLVNGLPAATGVSIVGTTTNAGMIRFVAFSDAPMGFNSLQLFVANPPFATQLNKVLFYKYRSPAAGQSSSILAEYDAIGYRQTRFWTGTSLPSDYQNIDLGNTRYLMGRQLRFVGGWTIAATASTLGVMAAYIGSSTAGSSGHMRFKFFGDRFTVYGSGTGATFYLFSAAISASLNVQTILSTLMINEVQVVPATTLVIQGVAVSAPNTELRNMQMFSPRPELAQIDPNQQIPDYSIPIWKQAKRFVGWSVGIGGICKSINSRIGMSFQGSSIPLGVSSGAGYTNFVGAYGFIQSTGRPIFITIQSATNIIGLSAFAMGLTSGSGTTGVMWLGRSRLETVTNPYGDAVPWGGFPQNIVASGYFSISQVYTAFPFNFTFIDTAPPGRYRYTAWFGITIGGFNVMSAQMVAFEL